MFFHGLSRFSLLAVVLLFVIGPFTKANSETGFVVLYRLHFFHTHTGERLDTPTIRGCSTCFMIWFWH